MIISLTKTLTSHFPVRIYINKIRNKITFKIRAGYCLDFLRPEVMKILGSTKNKVIEDENGETVPHS